MGVSDDDQEAKSSGSISPSGSSRLPEMAGVLSKWTNYIYGWQDRWFVLSHGTLQYFRSEKDENTGCRGAIHLKDAMITSHEFDNTRINVHLKDSSFFLRCANAEQCQLWREKLDGSKSVLLETSSLVSSTSSNNLVGLTGSVGGRHSRQSSLGNASNLLLKVKDMKERVGEMGAFRDILTRQLDMLQRYFDHVDAKLGEQVSDESNMSESAGGFTRAELTEGMITFKATSVSMIQSVEQFVEFATANEQELLRRVDKAVERRRKVEVENLNLKKRLDSLAAASGPDRYEGEFSNLKEDEYVDAMETWHEQQDELEKERQRAAQQSDAPDAQSSNKPLTATSAQRAKFREGVREHVSKSVQYAREEVTGSKLWTQIHEAGPMKVYQRDSQENGTVNNFLKAYHVINGVSAYEVGFTFWEPELRQALDGPLLDGWSNLGWVDEYTCVLHYMFKKIWPSAQRDGVFTLHFGRFDGGTETEFIVGMNPVLHDSVPIKQNIVRSESFVALITRTEFLNGKSATDPTLKRSDLRTHITYTASVNPGGWAPMSVVRSVSKREYPKFLTRLESHVQKHVHLGSPEESAILLDHPATPLTKC